MMENLVTVLGEKAAWLEKRDGRKREEWVERHDITDRQGEYVGRIWLLPDGTWTTHRNGPRFRTKEEAVAHEFVHGRCWGG